jgi:hypothetical protein
MLESSTQRAELQYVRAVQKEHIYSMTEISIQRLQLQYVRQQYIQNNWSMSHSITQTVQLQYIREQYKKITTTLCQTAVRIQYNYSMSESST